MKAWLEYRKTSRTEGSLRCVSAHWYCNNDSLASMLASKKESFDIESGGVKLHLQEYVRSRL